jgi:AcrR family transcriptional regulator
MTNQSVIMPSIVPETKRSLILSATRRLLVRRGFQDIVLDDVAQEAGVAKGTLFLHFKNKDELVSAAFADIMDQLGESLDQLAVSGKEGEPLLEETVQTVLAYIERNQDFMSLFGTGRFPSCGSRSCDMLMQRVSANKERMVRILKFCAKPMSLQITDMDYGAMALFGLCRSAVVCRSVMNGKKPLVSMTATVMDLFLHGVVKRK